MVHSSLSFAWRSKVVICYTKPILNPTYSNGGSLVHINFTVPMSVQIHLPPFKSLSFALARWSRPSPGLVSWSMLYVNVSSSTPASYLDSIIQSFLHSLQSPNPQPAWMPPPLDLRWLPLCSPTPIWTLLAVPVGSSQTSQVSPMLHCPLSHTHCSCSSAHTKVQWE